MKGRGYGLKVCLEDLTNQVTMVLEPGITET